MASINYSQLKDVGDTISVIFSLLMPMFMKRKKSEIVSANISACYIFSMSKLGLFISIILICTCCIKLFQITSNVNVIRTGVNCSVFNLDFVALNMFSHVYIIIYKVQVILLYNFPSISRGTCQ